MKKIISSLSASLILVSCSSNINTNQVIDTVNTSAKLTQKKKANIYFKFVKTPEIPNNIIDVTQKEAQKASDRASKTRDIDYFDIHKNPIGLEISANNEKAYILNYLGTSKNTEELNIEFRSIYTKSQNDYNFNYSGPITLSRIKNKNLEKGKINLNKNSSIRFELLTGMPPEYIVNRFENYIERELKPSLKMIYKVDANISDDDIFPYAVYNNDDIQGFFFLSSRGMVRLGDRKYADLQTGTFINTENEILAKYAVVGFNPKTKIGTQPKYEFKDIDNINIIETGDW